MVFVCNIAAINMPVMLAFCDAVSRLLLAHYTTYEAGPRCKRRGLYRGLNLILKKEKHFYSISNNGTCFWHQSQIELVPPQT